MNALEPNQSDPGCAALSGAEYQRYLAVLSGLRIQFPRVGRWIEDATQDLWLSLLRRPPPTEVTGDDARLAAWLRGALRRRLLDLIRKESRHRSLDLNGLPTSPGVEPPERCDPAAERQRVRNVLAAMKGTRAGPAAQLLELRYLEGRSAAQIGQAIGLNPRVVSTRLQRAKKRFRHVWDAQWGGAPGST